MRRKRRNQGAWLPIIPSTYEGGAEVTVYDTQFSLPLPVTIGDSTIATTPLTYDDSAEGQTSGAIESLRDKVEGQDYLLKRIVGKVWMDLGAVSEDSQLVDGIGCIAACVLPTDDAGAPSIPAEEYNPFFTQNAMQPWLWRRTWKLARAYTPGVQPWTYPPSTAHYHGSMDSGHIDTKGTFRRITKEHRVFLVAAFMALGVVGEGTDAAPISWGCDVRLYGQMRKARNNSSF